MEQYFNAARSVSSPNGDFPTTAYNNGDLRCAPVQSDGAPGNLLDLPRRM